MWKLKKKFYKYRFDTPMVRDAAKLIYDLPSPMKISYFWKFGSLLGLVLVCQLMTGVFLSMHFISDVSIAFQSVDLINREIQKGWMIRKFHMAGASIFFIYLYLHMGRKMYFFSFKLWKTWLSGVVIYMLTMAIAFLGYVLPWGQMSYWGATVMTKFFSVVPLMGPDLVVWMWGGFAVDYPTLTRFFSLHFLLPLILVVVILIHLVFLHETGSNKPLGLNSKGDKVLFFPLFILKDMFGFSMFFWMIYFFLLFSKNFMEYQKFLEANPLMTPTHIQPEWYFLPAYAILRAIPKKLGGVIALASFILVLGFLPLLKNFKKNKNFSLRKSSLKFSFQMMFWLWISNFFLLMWLGACPVEFPFLEISRVCSLMYFVFYFSFLVF